MKKRASDMGDDGKPIDVLREVADRLRTGDDIERRFALGLMLTLSTRRLG